MEVGEDDDMFVEQELGNNVMGMDYANAFHIGGQNTNSFEYQNKGKNKVMDLFAQVDVLNAASDEGDSDVEFSMIDTGKNQGR